MPLACGLLLVSTAATVPARAQDAAIVPTGAQNAQEPPAAPGEVEPVEQAPAVDVQALQAWRELKTPDEIERAYEKLKGSVQELEVSHTEAAIARYRAFYDAAGTRSVPIGLRLTSRVAQLYGQVLDDREAALDVLDWGIKHYVNQAGVSRLAQEREQMLRPKAESLAPVDAVTLKVGAVPLQIAPVASVAPSTTTRVPGEVASVQPVLEKRRESVQGVPNVVIPNAVAPVLSAPLGVTSAGPISPVAPVGALPSRAPSVAVAKVEAATATPFKFPVPVKAVTSGRIATGASTKALEPLGAPKLSSSGTGRTLLERVEAAGTPSRGSQSALISVSSGVGRLALVVEQMRAGKLTPREAWQARLLSLEEMVLALSEPELGLGNWYGYARELAPQDYALRQSLVELLVQHGGELVAKPDSRMKGNALSWRVQVSVGHYWRDRKDERAVAWYEAALAQVLAQGAFPSDGKDYFPLRVFYALEPLAHYYRETGQNEKAAQSFLRVEQLAQEKRIPAGWWVPDALVEAARLYVDLGQEQKAQEMYARVPSNAGWYAGLALFDQAQSLIQQGKHGEARALLNRPVTGSRAEAIQAVLLSTSGQLHYLSGNWAKAQADSQAAITRFQSLNPDQQGAGVDAVINMAEARLSWSQQWLKAPMVVEPQQLRVTWRRGQREEEPRTFKIWVRSGRPVPLQVSTNSKAVKATIEGESNNKDYFWQQEIAVTIQPEKLSQNATVEIRSASFANLTLSVPIELETQNAVALSSSTVFFGEVQAGQAAKATLEISALTPFRILAVTPDGASVKVQPDTNESGVSHTLRLTFTSPQAGRFYSGTLRIQTDVPNEEVIEVPYMARVK